MLSGVCKGLAAYFNVDITIVRIVFIALAIVTKGAFGIVYLVLMCVIPYATTSEERAAAHGQRFNAQELIGEATRSYAGFKNSREWKRQWRRQRREWRRHVPPTSWRVWGPPPRAPVGYTGQVFAGIMMPLLTVARTAAFWIWLCVLASLFSTNALFGWPIPDAFPSGLPCSSACSRMASWSGRSTRRGARPSGRWARLPTAGFRPGMGCSASGCRCCASGWPGSSFRRCTTSWTTCRPYARTFRICCEDCNTAA